MYPFLLKNGEIQWLSVKVRGIRLSSDGSHGVVIYRKKASLHDIEPITAESVLESMTDGFALLNNQFQFHYINEIAESMFRTTREKVVGTSLFDVFPEAVDSSFHHTYKKAMAEQRIIEFVDYYQPLGVWFHIKVAPLKKGGFALYFQDVSDQKRVEEQLLESVNYDYLTGMPNRCLLTMKSNALISLGKKFTIYYLNLDNLRLINAVYGHDAGDAVLKHVAGKLKGFTNENCEVFRLDGDEFAVLYAPEPKEKLENFAKAITDIFEQTLIVHNFQDLSIHVSIGISCYPNDALLFSEVISNAETAMYEAKKIRGSSYLFFRPAMDALRKRKSAIEEGLAGNLDDAGIYYTLQPQIDGSTREIVGAEVLARWAHPELGEISPLEFIEVAEATGTVVPLTLHLVEKVFIQMKEWNLLFGWSVQTAINMTPSLLANPRFFDSFFELIGRYEIQPEMVEIEITEQAELTYSAETLENLLLCKSRGISIAIDDFGTGFSMISYLTHFPINKIKIDRSFIQKIGKDRKSEAVLKSLIQLAKSIECELVAEGVERQEEVEFLETSSCTIHQGYLYDRPLQIRDFEAKYVKLDRKFFQESKEE
ncbi:bifunctional diguanylate cyclase/phosphodiesterase [Planomicrobium sp. YIM 101495]|uniref:putative bifunctional diguanylate cyclase/phosphodiesterase n=1 Tax=Planomicrobium sp. YIM 101495 TaxID=2665160 RepID=UPI0012B83422|nr:EAL domain-containing protein [Planomicrobium sp. YIM 101495]MTD31023.1 EAL domain-containing protein [Planomicrobium sp. YIM 101495]